MLEGNTERTERDRELELDLELELVGLYREDKGGHKGNKESFIQSLFNYFGVEKPGDIRMVYNSTSCGLNKAVWAPIFLLTTSQTVSWSLSFNYCFMDKDIGEMYLNFPLEASMARYSRIDLSHFKTSLGNKDMTRRRKLVSDHSTKTYSMRW